MSDVEFEIDNPAPRYEVQEKQPAMVGWLMKIGIKDARIANLILVILSVVAIGVSVMLLSGNSTPPSGKTPVPPGQTIPPSFSQ